MNTMNLIQSGRRLLCLALVLVMLLSVVGCTQESATNSSASLEASTGTTSTPSSTPTNPTVPATNPTDPTDPTEPTEPVSNVLVYTLTQEDVDEYYRLLEECETLSIAGEDMDAIDAVTEALDDLYMFLEEQYSIAQIHYYSDMADEELVQRHLDCADIYAEANDAYIQMARRVYLSDTPVKDELFADWTQEEIDQLLAYDPRVTELQKRNTELGVEYRASTVDSERIALYIEFVQNNNEIAAIYGYENYYTYAYDQVYERDYGQEELEQMRQYAKENLADALIQAYNNFYNTFYRLSSDHQQRIIALLYDDYDSVSGNYMGKYLDTMPQTLQDHVDHMLVSDSLFATSENALEGAFTTSVGDRSYCFFGPGYASAFTVIHEAGHYYASRYTDLYAIPMDLAEVHSQGNEWLFMRSLQENLATDQYNALVNYRIYSDLATILICLMVDEFEQYVYSTDLTGYTGKDFNAIMDSVCTQYMPVMTAMEYLTNPNTYWRQIVVEQPVYYISYGVSAIAAIDLYTVAVEDYDAAIEIYRKLCEEPVEDAGFLGNITAAGLRGPFQEEFYTDFVQMINDRKK